MISKIEESFRSGKPLSNNDREKLETVIKTSCNLEEIQSALYIYGREFPPKDEIVTIADRFIFTELIPGITSTSLKVVVDLWGLRGSYLDVLETFLDYSMYEGEWYDEVMVSASFFCRNPGLRTDTITPRLSALKRDAAQNSDKCLLDLLDKTS